MREDRLGDLRMGARVRLVPVSNSDRSDARVTEIIPRGEFAIWQAARVIGDHDLSTFLLRIDPIDDAPTSMAPGMTVSTTPAGP